MNDKAPKVVNVDEFRVAGLNVRTNNRDEMDPKTAKLPGLWTQFNAEKIASKIPHQLTSTPIFGVYSNYETDETGHYTVTAGIKVEKMELPQELTTITVVAGNYLVFENKGPIPQVVIATWQHIWSYFETNLYYTRHFKTDFEMYGEDGTFAVYIGIKA